MNKTARNVFRLYVIASKVRRLPVNATWTCYSQIAALPYSSNSKDHGLPVKSGIENQENNHFTLLSSKVKTSGDVFDIVKQYGTLMNGADSLKAFKLLDNMYRHKELRDLSIGKNIHFLVLCNILMENMKSLDVNDVVYVLKVCRYFGIPSTSLMCQSLLQFLRQSLSHLPFHSLIEFQTILRYFERTPLSEALLIAIPIMCTIQLENKMVDLTSMLNLTSALSFLTVTETNRKVAEMVINALRAKGSDMHVNHARKILKHMCDLKYLPHGYQEVTLISQKIITENIDQLTVYSIQILLSKIVKQVHHLGNQHFYNEEYIDTTLKTLISRDFGFKQGIYVSRSLCNLNHTHIKLIDYLAAKCFENPEVVRLCSQVEIMSLVKSIATADYKPIFWESMKESILKNMDKEAVSERDKYIDFITSMAVLDFYDVGLVEKVFSKNYLANQMWQNHPDICWHLVLLYQSMKTFCPEYTGPWPPEYIIDGAMNFNNFEKPSLLGALERALGGSQYILSNLRSTIGHQIDHVIVMRKGGYPVALNSIAELSENKSIRYIEELQLPAESQVIMIINLPAVAYMINSRRLKGQWRLLLDTLETHTRHTVIPVNSMMWMALPDQEKIPYLMQAIRLKCDGMSASANV